VPAWQRDLARRLSAQVDLTDDDYTDAFAMVRRLYGLPAGPASAPEPLQRKHISVGANGQAARLLALGGL
jgi:hypothetical protein